MCDLWLHCTSRRCEPWTSIERGMNDTAIATGPIDDNEEDELWSRKTHSSFADRASEKKTPKSRVKIIKINARRLRPVSANQSREKYMKNKTETAPGALNSEYDGLLGFATYSGRPIAMCADTDVWCLLFGLGFFSPSSGAYSNRDIIYVK